MIVFVEAILRLPANFAGLISSAPMTASIRASGCRMSRRWARRCAGEPLLRIHAASDSGAETAAAALRAAIAIGDEAPLANPLVQPAVTASPSARATARRC